MVELVAKHCVDYYFKRIYDKGIEVELERLNLVSKEYTKEAMVLMKGPR